MAVTFTGAGTTQNATGQGSTIVTTSTAFAVGDYFVVLMAYDNSGGGGADPMSGTLTLTVTGISGALSASVSAQTGHNDPGSASAGLAARCVAYPVAVTIPTSTNITVAWTGTANAKAIVLMKVSSSSGGIMGYRTNHGATGTNTVAAANATAFVTPSVNNTEGVLCWTCEENGIALTGDADTTNGTWGSIYGTFNATTAGVGGMAAYFQGKVVTATATQTFNPTGNATASDWITGCLIFTETPVPSITQAAYQFFDDAGTESGASSLAALNTAVTGNLTNGDGYGAIRVRLQSTTAVAVPATDDFTLQWEKNASGTWNNAVGEALADSYPSSNQSGNAPFGASGAPPFDKVGQSFLGNGAALRRVGLFLKIAAGTPTQNISVLLYAHSGTFGTNGIPTGSVLATSTSISATTLTSTYAWFYFDFDGTFTLANGTPYVLVASTDVLNASNYIHAGMDTTSPTHAGNYSSLGNSWAGVSSQDLIFELYTGSSTAAVIEYDNPNLTNGAATTNRLGAGSGSFVAGKVSETGSVVDFGWTANNYTELLYSVKLIAANLANGDTLRFRVLRNGATTNMTYSQTPTVNITLVLPAITQAAYRFYDETGTESGSIALAAQDTAITGTLTGPDGFGHLRVRLQATTAVAVPSTYDFTLQWEKNASGTWVNVGTGAVVGYNSPNLTEGQATTNRLGAGSGSFVAGKASEDGVVDDLGWTASNYTEVLYSVRLVASQLTNSDTLRFRVLKNGATTDMTYTVTPTINLVVPAFGQSVRFDGGGDHYAGPAPGAQTAFTMCCWVYPTTTASAIIGGFDGTTYNHLALSSSNQLQFWQSAGSTTLTTPTIPVNTWAFVAVSYDNAGSRTMYLWRDGDTAFTTQTVSTAGGGIGADQVLGICGDSFTTFPINGRIAGVKIWTAALTQAELALEREYNRTVARTTNLWAFYSFTQGPSTYDNAEIGGRNLTAVGALTAEAGPPDPIPMSGLYAWGDSDVASSFVFGTGSAVAQWKDLSGRGNHLIQGTAGNQPARTGTLNGKPVVTFDGVDDKLPVPSWTLLSQPITVCVVFQSAGMVGGLYQAVVDCTNVSLYRDPSAGGNLKFFGGGTEVSATVSDGTPYVVTFVMDGASSKQRLNGVQVGSPTNTGTGTMPVLAIGASAASVDSLNGFISGFAIWNRALSAGEITSVEAYYTTKWIPVGLPLVVANAAQGVTSDNVTLTLPSSGPPYTDDFNRTNGAPGSPWELESGAYLIATNQLARQGTGGDFIRYNTAMPSNDHYVQARVWQSGGGGIAGSARYLVLNLRGSGTYSAPTAYAGFFDPTGNVWTFARFDSGSYSTISTRGWDLAGPPDSGDLLRLEIEGNTLSLYRNGVLAHTYTDTASPITTGTYVGLNTNTPPSGSHGFDDFEAGDIAPAGISYELLLDQRVVNNGTSPGGADYTSSSFTTAAGTLLVAITMMYTGGACNELDWPYNIPLPVTSGLTWKHRCRKWMDGTFACYIDVWMADNASAGSKTISQTGTHAQWDASINCIDLAVFELTGAAAAALQSNTFQIGGRGYASGVDPGAQSLTLPVAPAADSIVIAVVAAQVYQDTAFTVTPGADFTETTDRSNGNTSTGPFLHSQTQVRLGSTSPTVAWVDIQAGGSGSDTYCWALAACEFKAAGATPVSQAVRFSGSGNHYTRAAAGWASGVPMTACMWVKVMVDTDTYATALANDNGGARYWQLGMGASGVLLAHGWTDGGFNYGYSAPVGEWVWMAIVKQGTAISGGIVAWKPLGQSQLGYYGHSQANSSLNTGDPMMIGTDGFGDIFNGSVAAIKMWTAALTTEELLLECYESSPVRTADLFRYWSFAGGPSLVDDSGGSNTLTAVGTPVIDTNGPPINVTQVTGPTTYDLVVANAAHVQASEAPVLTLVLALVVADAAQLQTAQTAQPAVNLVVADAAQLQAAQTAQPAVDLVVAGATQLQTAQTAQPDVILTVNSAAQLQAADAVTVAVNLVVADAIQLQTAQQAQPAVDLIVASAAQLQTAANVTLANILAPLNQEGFRWRNDDGSETTATWMAAQDTNTSLALATNVRLRTLLDTSADVTITPTLYYKKSTDSVWLPVPVGSGGGDPVYIATSSNITAGGQATTALLTAPSGKTTADFSVGRMWDDENGLDDVVIGAAAFADDFNRANGALGSPWLVFDAGGGGSLDIVSNKVSTSTGESRAIYSAGIPADHWAELNVQNGSNEVTLGARIQNASGYYCYYPWVTGGQVELWKRTSGGYSSLGSPASLTGPPVTIRVEAEGTTIRVYADDVLKITVTDSDLTSGEPGLYGYTSVGAVASDNFRCGPLPWTAP